MTDESGSCKISFIYSYFPCVSHSWRFISFTHMLEFERRCDALQTAPSVCTASIASQAVKMDVLVYNRTKEYLPDVQDQSWSLGKGGCFTTVER